MGILILKLVPGTGTDSLLELVFCCQVISSYGSLLSARSLRICSVLSVLFLLRHGFCAMFHWFETAMSKKKKKEKKNLFRGFHFLLKVMWWPLKYQTYQLSQKKWKWFSVLPQVMPKLQNIHCPKASPAVMLWFMCLHLCTRQPVHLPM